MFRGMAMVAAMVSALTGPPSGKSYTVGAPLQSDESKKYHLDRASAKRARKAAKLKVARND